VQISYTGFYPNQSINKESMNIKTCVLWDFMQLIIVVFTDFWDNSLVPPLWVKSQVGIDTFSLDFGKKLSLYAAQSSKRSQILFTLRRKPEITDINLLKPLNKADLGLLRCQISRYSLSHFTFSRTPIANFIDFAQKKAKIKGSMSFMHLLKIWRPLHPLSRNSQLLNGSVCM
jgi:hypothetical protein